MSAAPRGRLGEGAHRRRRQAAERQPGGFRGCCHQHGAQRVVVGDFGVAKRRDHQERTRPVLGQQVAQQGDRRTIGTMQIVEDKHHGARLSGRHEQTRHRAEQQVPAGVRIGAAGRRQACEAAT
jgi:hypothetical protein